MAEHDHETTWTEFKQTVNMTASALEKYLDSEKSGSVGQKKDGAGEATGHKEGRRIVEMLGKKKGDLTDEDYEHMRKVVGYVNRHLKQGGPKDKDAVKDSPWRLSLMNWGTTRSKVEARAASVPVGRASARCETSDAVATRQSSTRLELVAMGWIFGPMDPPPELFPTRVRCTGAALSCILGADGACAGPEPASPASAGISRRRRDARPGAEDADGSGLTLPKPPACAAAAACGSPALRRSAPC